MKNTKITILLCVGIPILIMLIVLGIMLYFEIQENKRLDAEAVSFNEDLTIEGGTKAKVSDFIANLTGTLVDDFEVDTSKLGETEVTFEYRNIKNKKRKKSFQVTVVDHIEPKIFGGNSYTIKLGSDKDLTEIFLSGDNIDNKPKREILGEYDVNVAGEYNLVYQITDASGNQAKKDFKLYVKEPKKTTASDDDDDNDTQTEIKTKTTAFESIIQKHKTEQTKVGIDVSKWQGDIDWNEVKNAGAEFVMIRVGYQTGYDKDYTLDPYFKQYIEGATKVGLPVGVYFFSYAKTPEQAINQANWVKQQIAGYQILLPICFDWENWTSFNQAEVSFYTLNKIAEAFCNTVKDSGYQAMNYGSKSYLTNIWEQEEYPTWVAHYTENAKQTNYEGEYMMWQVCENGKISGIKEKVDIDVLYLPKSN